MDSRFAVALIVLSSVATASRAQTLTPLELKCQLGASKAEAKFVQGKLRCVQRCWYDYWHSGSMSSYADCLPPFGGATALCIDDTIAGLKGVENKFSYSILKVCAKPTGTDCPECYSGGDCDAEASTRPADVGSGLDGFVPGIYCERATAMPQEQKCQYNVSKQLAKLVNEIQKCYAKCQSNAAKGLFPVSACQPPASDIPTDTCLLKAQAKSQSGIDKLCNDAEVPHSIPECDDPGTYPDGATWTSIGTAWVSGEIATLYCGD